MAQSRATSLCFKAIAIHKDQILGVGAYGTVCKATCDDLQCAAKVLHPDLILTDQQTQTVRPEDRHRLPMRRFEEECRFLRLIRHPNIILFLGMSRDSTGLPALLMELMDENLTTFLERDPETLLQFHTQVSICHDVASALSYLHSNEIYHRDLSSNNVLMIGDRRAKVTDFGMAVFEGAHRKKTEMPGTAAYMPPEVRGANAISSDKTDVFSLGVLIIQIMTRLFPEPVEEPSSVPIKLWGIVSGSENVEIEKRRNHITLVRKDHPLLPVSTSCLKYKCKNRPTSSVVCRQLGELEKMDYTVYSVAVEQVVPELEDVPVGRNSKDTRPHPHPHPDEHQSVEHDSSHSPIVPEKKRIKFERYNQREVGNLVESTRNVAVNEPFEEIHMQESTRVFTPPPQVQDISESTGVVWHLREHKTPTPMRRNGSGTVVLEDCVYMLHGENRDILHSFYPRHQKWLAHPSPPVELGSLAVVNNRVVLVGGRKSSKLYSLIEREWKSKLPSMPTKRHSVTIASSSSFLIAIGGVGKGKKYLRKVEVLDIDEGCWFSVANFPDPCAGLSACICNGRVYVLGNPNFVFTSEMKTLINPTGITAISDTVSGVRVWESVQDLPVSSATCVAVWNKLYAVGGKFYHGMPTTSIYRYNQHNQTWCIYANMKEARSQCFVAMVNSPPAMVVVGGVNSSGSMSDTTESASWRSR